MVHLKVSVVLALLGMVLASPMAKIDPKLQVALANNSKVNIFITMRDSTAEILSSITNTHFLGRSERLNAVHETLVNHAAQSQKTVLSFLERSGVKYQSYWISNQIFVENADSDLVQKLAWYYDIDEITEEVIVELEKPEFSTNSGTPQALQWGVEKIGADKVWALAGNTDGSGVVVGGIDTGVRYTHVDLRGNWRDTYGWRDPAGNSATPSDNNGHGTHTMGTIAGANGIGVAPGAQWVACKGCATSSCSQNDLTACGQWMACPTNPQGQNPDCSKAPHVVSNSWGGGQGSSWYNGVITSWVAAGIVPMFSQGNSGPNCNTANSPGDQPQAIGVGSTTNTDGLSNFSSKGPSGNLIKPDISAPGGNVYSSWHTSDTAYNTISGTSMACPHAAGAVALVLGISPNATISNVKDILYNNAHRDVVSTGRNCGGINENVFPNNAYGYGRVDVFRSVQSIIGKY